MQLLLLNGSPKGKKSNTKVLLDTFLKGYDPDGTKDVTIHYLHKLSNHEAALSDFQQAQKVIIAFPLYTDAMPGILMKFIEAMEPFRNKQNNPDIGCIVQSGFPEAHHSKYVGKYLEKLARRLGSDYLGTVIKGSIEGIKVKPHWMIKKTLAQFEQLGSLFAKTGTFDEKLIAEIEKPVLLSGFTRFFISLLNKAGLMNFYWNMQLKKNNVYDKRFAQPYKNK